MNATSLNSVRTPEVNSELPPSKNSNTKIILFTVLVVVIGLVYSGTLAYLIAKRAATSSTSVQPQASTVSSTSYTQIDHSKPPFLVGAVFPLSGDGASYGVPAKQASLVIQKDLNKHGGIGGREVKFLFEDGRCASKDAGIAAKKLIEEQKVELLHGGECSDEFLAAAPIAQAKKIISMSAAATSPKISELGKYIFRTIPSDNLAGKAAAQYASTRFNAKTAAVVVEKTEYAQALKSVFVSEFEKNGGKITVIEDFETGTTDFAQIVSKIKEANVDVIYTVPQTPTPGVIFVQTLKSANVTAKILTAEVLLTRDEVSKQGKILEGVTGIETYFDENSFKAKYIIDAYSQEYGKDNTYPTDLVAIYDFMYIYKEAYEKIGSNDTDKISEYIYTIKDWQGASGTINFDFHGDVTSLPYAIRLIKDKKVPLVEAYTVK